MTVTGAPRAAGAGHAAPAHAAPVPAPAPPTHAPSAPACGPVWTIVRSPNTLAGDDNTLQAVSADAPGDAWAVGFSGSGSAGHLRTLVLHWDGAAWRVVASPNQRGFATILNDVVALGPDDVWAVGASANTQDSPWSPLAMHWNGSGWRSFSMPMPFDQTAALLGVARAGPSRLWAVGYEGPASGDANRTLVWSWDGHAWRTVPSPTPRTGVTWLTGIDALGRGDAWAVGVQGDIGVGTTLAERWDGSAWHAVPTPGRRGAWLQDVVVLASDDVWAVGGWVRPGATGHGHTLALHFDGASWSAVPTPPVDTEHGLEAVANAPGTLWAVGTRTRSTGGTRTLIERWTGSAGTVVASPNRDSDTNRLVDVAADPAGDLWAVGITRDMATGVYRTLILSRCPA
jgi:hypothetical protein